jgi:sialic acid synthase SpsE
VEIVLKNGRKIGDGHPPYIVAEVGSNWTSLEDCLESIHQAKLCGADAVKFQLYTSKELFGRTGFMFTPAGYTAELSHWVEQSDYKQTGELPPEWLPKLKAEADKRGIDFMCTAFSPEGYDVVNEYVDMHKVASSECCHVRILQKLRTFGKPVILSTGAKGVEDIRGAVDVLSKNYPPGFQPGPAVDVILMYCAVSYPASYIDLQVMDMMAGKFQLPVGYSDHSTDILEIPARACFRWKAPVLEKHFKIHDMNTPDNPHSLNPAQFKLMVQNIRSEYEPRIGPTPEEKTAILRYNRRLIATKDMSPGDELKEGVNFGIYRSLVDDTRAAHPFMVDKFNGTRAKVPLKAGQGLWIEDVDAKT